MGARPPWGLWLAVIVAAAGFGGLGWWAGQRALLPAEQAPPPGLIVAEPGDIAPTLTLTDLRSGAPVRLQPRGRPRLINYWASWCAPCREELPVLAAYAAEQGDQGVQVTGIALDSANDALAFLGLTPPAFELLVETPGERDSSVQLGNARGALPYTVLIDAHGRLQRSHYGAFKSVTELRAWVAGEN